MKITPFFTVLFFLWVLPFTGQACVHTSRDLPGVSTEAGLYIHHKTVVNEVILRQFVNEMIGKTCATDAPGTDCADLLAAYLYLHEYDKAQMLSKTLLKNHSDTYAVLINHAMLLELQGKYREALKYLKQAIAFDPGAHLSSEWIHQKELEKRVAGKTKPKISILGLNFGNEEVPVLPDSLILDNSLEEQLDFQINSRLFFAESPDALFASLLFDYANLVEHYHMNALENYTQAYEYGCTDTLMPKRLDYAIEHQNELDQFSENLNNTMALQQSMQSQNSRHSNTMLLLKVGSLLVSVVGAIVHFSRRKNG